MRLRQTSKPVLGAGQRLKICWLVPGFPQSIDDANYSFLGREARELAALDVVDLLIVVVDGPWTGETHHGFDVMALDRPSTKRAKAKNLWTAFALDPTRFVAFCRRPKAAYPTLWRVGALAELLRDWKPDVVHSHFAVPNGTCGIPVARALAARCIVSLRGVDLAIDEGLGYGFRLDRCYDREFRSALARVDLGLTSTEHMRKLALDAGAVASRLAVLPNSVSFSGHHSRASPKLVSRPMGADRVLLSVGHLIELKGFDRGIRALAHLPSDHHYVIVGEGIDKAALKHLSVELGVADRTHFLGEISPAEVAEWMKEADCYWFLSKVEAFGNVVMEAFAAGAKIAATSCGVAPELAQGDHAITILAEPDDPRLLAEVTRGLFDTEIPENRSDVLKRFSSERRSHDLLKHYEDSSGAGDA